MARSQIESNLLTSALIESDLTPIFRFTKIRFHRTLNPPDYQSNQVKESKNFECFGRSSSFEVPAQSKPWPNKGDFSDADDFGIHTLIFSADGKQLVVGSANTSVRVISVPDGGQLREIRPSKWKLGMPITCLRYLPNSINWVLGSTPEGEIFCVNPSQEGFETLIREENRLTYCLNISSDGAEMATAGNDTSIRIYDIHPGQLSGSETCFIKGKSNKISSTKLRFGDRSEKPVGCSASKVTRNRQNPSLNSKMPEILGYRPAGPADNHTEGHSMRITALKYHPTQPRVLVSASWDHYVKIWDTRTRNKPIDEIYGPLVCSPDGLDIDDHYVLTASWRKSQALEIWDLRNLYTKKRDHKLENNGDVLNTLNKHAYMCPAETIPVENSTEVLCGDGASGEYLYAARLLPSRAVICGGSGFREVRVMSRETKMVHGNLDEDRKQPVA
ncbi:hypothetical protein ACTXT7_009613 [Hymenolepis weldensis]